MGFLEATSWPSLIRSVLPEIQINTRETVSHDADSFPCARFSTRKLEQRRRLTSTRRRGIAWSDSIMSPFASLQIG